MRETDFFIKLLKEGKLMLVEKSDDIKSAYFKKSESYLISARLLLDNDRLEESVSMSYYSMYYSLQALLFKIGIKCENHTASIMLLKKIFDIDTSCILFAKKERIDKQYYVNFSVSKKDAEELIKSAQNFNAKILNFTDRMSNDGLVHFRKKADNLLRL